MAAAFYAPVPQAEEHDPKKLSHGSYSSRRRVLWIMILAAVFGSILLTGLLQANNPSSSEDSDKDSLDNNHHVRGSEDDNEQEAFGDSLDETNPDLKFKAIVDEVKDDQEQVDNEINNDDSDSSTNLDQDNNQDEQVYEVDEQDQGARLNITDHNNSSVVGGSCTYWSESFRKKYSDTCGYWIDVYNKWERRVDYKSLRQVAYFCSGTSMCHGWGDRVAGMLASFHKALDDGVQFRIGHDYLSNLFNPCVVGSNRRVTNWAKNKFRKPIGMCEVRNVACSTFMGTHCSNPSIISYNSDRMCIAKSHCEGMLHQSKDLSAARVVGCGLRAMLEPSKEMFEDIKFPIRIDGQTQLLNLKSVEETFSKYYVISIQMRLGDSIAFFSKTESNIFQTQRRMLSFPFRCAETVESYLRKKQASKAEYEDDPEETIHGKPIRYFLATDTFEYRQMAQELFGDKLITFDFKPEHIAFGGSAKFALAKEIAEWYTLGLGRQLVLNKVGLSNNFYKGRFSGFAKTSWVYHLKHMVYDAGTCKQFSLPFSGTWSDADAKGCGRSALMRGRTNFGNNHLVPLWDQNLTFPHYYVLNGQITRNGKID